MQPKQTEAGPTAEDAAGKHAFRLFRPICVALNDLQTQARLKTDQSKPARSSAYLTYLEALRDLITTVVPPDGLRACFDYVLFPISQVLLYQEPLSAGPRSKAAIGAPAGGVDAVHEVALRCVLGLLERCPDEKAGLPAVTARSESFLSLFNLLMRFLQDTRATRAMLKLALDKKAVAAGAAGKH